VDADGFFKMIFIVEVAFHCTIVPRTLVFKLKKVAFASYCMIGDFCGDLNKNCWKIQK